MVADRADEKVSELAGLLGPKMAVFLAAEMEKNMAGMLVLLLAVTAAGKWVCNWAWSGTSMVESKECLMVVGSVARLVEWWVD